MNIRPEFSVHMLNSDGKAKAQDIACDFSRLLESLEARGVTGRELAIVKTKLEEACFFSKRSIASQTCNQETP